MASAGSAGSGKSPAVGVRLRSYWLPALAGSLTITIVILLFWAILKDWQRQAAVQKSPDADDSAALLAAGQKALSEGEFQRGLDKLEAAEASRKTRTGSLTSSEARQLKRLLPQARLLANLLSEPLQDILVRAPGVPDREWPVQFARLYQGKSVIFDAGVRLEGDRFVLDYFLEAEGKPVRIELTDVKLLLDLKAHGFLKPGNRQRLFFGVRLAGIAREVGGVWLIRFEPESAALLDDVNIAAAVSPLPLDAEQRAVIELQSKWLQELP